MSSGKDLVWAWCSPCEPKDMIIPRREDYPDYEFWEGPFLGDCNCIM